MKPNPKNTFYLHERNQLWSTLEQIKSFKNKSTNFFFGFEKFLFVFCSCFSIRGCFPDPQSRFRFSVFGANSIFGRRSSPKLRGWRPNSRLESEPNRSSLPTPSSVRDPKLRVSKLRFRLWPFRFEICLFFLR